MFYKQLIYSVNGYFVDDVFFSNRLTKS